jgi:hypothetical protein
LIYTSIIDLSDGLTVLLAATTCLSCVGESGLVILGGIAELITGAISMGIGGFLTLQAERDYPRSLRHTALAHAKRACKGGMGREVHFISLGLLGVESNEDQSNGHVTNVKHGLKPKRSKSVGFTESLLKAWRSSRCAP